MSPRPKARTAIVALALALGAFPALAGTAAATVVHEKEAGFPRIKTKCGEDCESAAAFEFIALDNSAGPSRGDLYIGSAAAGTFASRVFQATPGGALTGVQLKASETPAGSFGFLNFATEKFASGPAVDGSTGAHQGDIYVPDVENGVVDRFDETGAYLCQISGAGSTTLTTVSPSECDSATSGTPSGSLEPLSVAVDPGSGRVAVGDASGVVYEFDEAGGYEGEIADPHITAPFSLAFDSTGDLYVVNADLITSFFGSAVKLDPAGSFQYQLGSGRFAVGVDLASDRVYLGAFIGQTEEFDPSGNALSGFGIGTNSVAVNQSTGQVYLTPPSPPENEIWSGDIFIPGATTGAATGVAETSATLHGEADPEIGAGGSEIEACRFEYLSEAAFHRVQTLTGPGGGFALEFEGEQAHGLVEDASAGEVQEELEALAAIGPGNVVVSGAAGGPWTVEFTGALGAATLPRAVLPFIGFIGQAQERATVEGDWGAAASSPCEPSPPYSATTQVEAGLEGLAAGAVYRYRLTAENEAGREGEGEEATLTTFGPPSVGGEVSISRPKSATLKGQVNPYGYETECNVEYVDQARFEASGYAGAATAPCPEGLAAGFGEREVSLRLDGLAAGTTYHYRFVAHNEAESEGGAEAGPGTEDGPDRTFSTFGIESFSLEALDAEGDPYAQAGGHPYELRIEIAFPTTAPVGHLPQHPASVTANLRTVKLGLPAGLIANPTAAPRCEPYQMSETDCPATTQIGTAKVFTAFGASPEGGQVVNLAPPPGVAGEVGAHFSTLGNVRIEASVRSGTDYGIDTETVSVTAAEGVARIEMTLWGVPADEAHRAERVCRGATIEGCPSEAPLLPFLTNPTSCTGPLSSSLSVDSWQAPGEFVSSDAPMEAITGCDRLHFDPAISVRPDLHTSESPTGLDVDLHVPQNQNPNGLAEANLRDTTVRLPAGVAVNAAGANGLDACTTAQIGYKAGTSAPAEFTPDPAQCPDASKVGSVEVHTPLLDHPVKGSVYVAAPYDNPFGSLLAIYIAVHDPESGVVLKLPGKVTPDPQTQLTATFSDNPQLPFEDFELDFFGGPRAALMTPATCGEYTTTTDMRPWSENGDKHPFDSFSIDKGPDGGPCATTPAALPNRQSFSAGAINPVAGDETPFVVNVSRPDGTQRLSRIDAALPPGLLGRLAGIPYCPQPALAAAVGKTGAAELATPSCPAASRVGSVRVGAGAGPRPYFVNGTAYLAGPYKGAPLSLAVVTPAVAGPFDLGTVVVRVALYVNPVTAQITAKSDPLPQILEGIPLDVREIRLQADITRNPTSCEEMAVGGTAFSVLGQAASLSDRFQVGGCAGLGFKPNLSIRLKGATHRRAHPKLIATLKPRPGDANISFAQVKLPKAAFLDNTHIRTVCTRVQFAAEQCPAGSIYGKAQATTPLLDYILNGTVYLRSSNHTLPDLVVAFKGPPSQPIKFELAGRTDSVKGALRNTFEYAPDVPVSKFRLELFGGKKGLVILSSGLCKHRNSTIRFRGHNGKEYKATPKVKASCGKGAKKYKKPKRRRHSSHSKQASLRHLAW